MAEQIEVFSKDQKFIVLVDDEDYPLLSRHHWNILFVGSQNRPYAFTRLYNEEKKNGKTLLMHSLIMGNTRQHDHKNGNSLDNRKENLRPATNQENGWNKGKPKRSRYGEPASQYKGVVRCVATDGRVYWRVIIKLSKKGEVPARHARLGPFDSELEAARAYNEEIVKHRGPFAWVNPLPDVA